MTAETTAETLDACRRGDPEALGAVLRAHAPGIERLLVRLLGPRADVEDLLQITLMEAIRAFPRFQGKASVATWLGRIAVHVAHQHLRRPEQRRARVRLELVRDQDAPVSPGPAPDRTVDARRQLEKVYAHLDAIGPRKRVAFVLFAFEGRPVDEVAALTGASRVVTKARIFWARRELVARVAADPMLCELVDEGREGQS
jgi:RNA polymerase sigma-70 factor (ECF subfamily)